MIAKHLLDVQNGSVHEDVRTLAYGQMPGARQDLWSGVYLAQWLSRLETAVRHEV